MQEPYESGVATHIGPESCGAAREGGAQGLTGECAGRVLSRVSLFLRDADAVGGSGRQHPEHRYREACQSSARSETPGKYAGTSRGNREISCSPRTEGVLGRIRKSLAHLPGDRAEVGKTTFADIQEQMVRPKRAAFQKGDSEAGLRVFMGYVFDDAQAWDRMPDTARQGALDHAREGRS